MDRYLDPSCPGHHHFSMCDELNLRWFTKRHTATCQDCQAYSAKQKKERHHAV